MRKDLLKVSVKKFAYFLLKSHFRTKFLRNYFRKMWIFGYGSLLWYTEFPYRSVVPGVVRGYSRRFWQLSPDHRGTESSVGSFSTTCG